MVVLSIFCLGLICIDIVAINMKTSKNVLNDRKKFAFVHSKHMIKNTLDITDHTYIYTAAL